MRNIKDEVSDRLVELAPEQAAYEEDLNSLPALAGDGRFAVAVDLRGGDLEAFENYIVYLEATGQQNESVTTLLAAVDRSSEAGIVEVSLGQAYMGKLAGKFANELYLFIEEQGGRMACAGLLRKHKDQPSFTLDIANPPQLEV